MRASSSLLAQLRSSDRRPAPRAVDPVALAVARERLESVLQQEGLHGALAFLNRRTRHRFTGVYRFATPMLVNVALFDRENPTLHARADIHLITQTYCQIVQAEGRPFVITNARRDTRVAAHPARERIISYCGVPLSHPDGTVYGVICHHDLRPRVTSDSEVRFLEGIAPLLYQGMCAEESRV